MFDKTRSMGAQLFRAGWRADGRTDMMTLKSSFSNRFVKAPKMFTSIYADIKIFDLYVSVSI
jgi:hypothetical protein